MALTKTELRFLTNLNKTEDGCWLWRGKERLGGYGTIWVERKNLKVQRYSWMIHFEPIAVTTLVASTCNNQMCVNPDHLYIWRRRKSERVQEDIKQ
jgi:hypothetical protein